MDKAILVLQGPNLATLGKRETSIYGTETLAQLQQNLADSFPSCAFTHVISNHEGVLLDRLNACLEEEWDGIIINAGALTHTSYALYDALNMLSTYKVEVHISHIFSREPFRHTSVISPACDVMISGVGTFGYHLAVQALLNQ